MTHDELVAVIKSLRPNAKWAINGLTITWDDGVQTEPTPEEIDAEYAVLFP